MANAPEPQTLTAFAAMINANGVTLFKYYPLAELKEIWERLPNVAKGMNAPVGQRSLAERIALYIHELGQKGPPLPDGADDARRFLTACRKWPKVREYKIPTEAIPFTKLEENDMKSETTTASTSAASSAPATARPAAKPAKTGVKARGPADPWAGTPPGTGKPAKAGPRGSKSGSKGTPGTAAKTPATGTPKNASKTHKATSAPTSKKAGGTGQKNHPATAKPTGKGGAKGPRAGTITELICTMTSANKSTDVIAKAIVKTFPDTVAGKEIASGDTHCIRWFQMQCVKRGWLSASLVK